MFTGIVQQVGQVTALQDTPDNRRITVTLPAPFTRTVRPGDSIAVNGVCLTAVESGQERFVADISVETLRVTSLGSLAEGVQVNVEPALTLADPLGGHLVSGHVDGLGRVAALEPREESLSLWVELPEALMRYVAVKGSICIDGVSLTVNAIDGQRLGVHLVPHTLSHTVMNGYREGTVVNIEVDLLARYLERLIGREQ
ncbi:MAG: riboflavin synthase [Chromatiales bacterium]|nr:riboflavin synthase [Chromatiales bacterium]